MSIQPRSTFSSLVGASRILLLVPVLLLYGGCKKSEGPTSPGPPVPIGKPISDSLRTAVIGLVQQKFASLAWLNLPADNQQMAQFLKSLPAFEDAGVLGGNAWGRFVDGRLLLVVHNRPVGDSLLGFEKSPIRRIVQDQDLPSSRQARVLNAMGSHFVNPTGALNALLSGNGYQIVGGTGSVDSLKSVQGDGVFYISAHGGEGLLSDSSHDFGVWTSTRADSIGEKKYRTELDSKELCYLTEDVDDTLYGANPTVETHYAITRRFVIAYMAFGKNCLIYIDACRSANQGFRDACLAASEGETGVYVGWTDYVGDQEAYRAARFVFDRLLGANASFTNNSPPKEIPPQRPFDYKQVWADMDNRGFDRYQDRNNMGNLAYLTYYTKNSTFSLLAPSIMLVSVDEVNGQLHVVGTFGTDPGESDRNVSVDGVHLNVVEGMWTPTEIVCVIPASGAGSAGDVVVEVRGHKSNPVQLTDWSGLFHAEIHGSLIGSFAFYLHMRADIHSFRFGPHADLITFPNITLLAPDSRGSYTVGGTSTSTCTFGSCTLTLTQDWASSGASIPRIPVLDAIREISTGFAGTVDIDTSRTTMKILLYATAKNAINESFKVHVACPDGSSDESYQDTLDFGLDGPGRLVNSAKMKIRLDNNYGIQAGTSDTVYILEDNFSGSGCDASKLDPFYVSWDNIPAHFPPNPDSPRDATPASLPSRAAVSQTFHR